MYRMELVKIAVNGEKENFKKKRVAEILCRKKSKLAIHRIIFVEHCKQGVERAMKGERGRQGYATPSNVK